MNRAELLQKSCQHLEQAASPEQLVVALSLLTGWSLEEGQLVRRYDFRDYHETIAFVNAIATIIHQQDHHPYLFVGYNHCIVRYSTHSVNKGKGGISENDFICAAKIDDVFDHHFSHS